ncbi:MAG: endonuclease/exonuclease/phosphatase family protein [Hyphomicrobiaceae bacterium]
MIVLSWNIQNGKGTDNRISLERIASVIRDMCTPDVICLQEVTRHLPLDAVNGAPDQAAELEQLFPDYELTFGCAIEARLAGADGRWQFGNATLSRLPVLSVFHHPLPQPAESGVRHMPRQATEITVAQPNGPLRIINTHLEFHSARQRMAQVRRMRDLHDEAVANVQTPPNRDASGPYQMVARPEDCVVCGDFNMEPTFDEYAAMISSSKRGAPCFHDAWRIANGDRPHPPTCGIHDHDQWPAGPHCRDFFFVSHTIASRSKEVQVDTVTNASDHQPLLLRLAEEQPIL